jgi:NAD(P)-dependent dehydrogenase (short-subunit alcohol dehydrogenase family)
MMQISLEGRVALVTGAGDGIGRGCALVLAEAGADVVVNDINAESGEATVAAVRQKGLRSLFVEADVSDEAAVASMLERVRAEFGALQVLVNNAGCNLHKGIADTTPEEWDRVLGVDLKGIYLVTRAALPLLREAGSASIINIASVHATMTIADITAYAAAKGGVLAMGRSLAQELGPQGIRVNTISPGFIRTSMVERWLASTPDPQAAIARVLGFHPLGHIGAPEDIGNMAAFLASDLAGNITGANLMVDGGLTTRLMH